MIQNDLLLKSLQGEPVNRPPVWMMRQAGRFLPSYQRLREKYDFFTRCQTPELVADITCLPVDELGVDAAILFSDILVVPQAMGVHIDMQEGRGPVIHQPIEKPEDVNRLEEPDVTHTLGYVFQGIRATLEKLNGRVPLIGFAGAPWTLLCYLVEGKGSAGFEQARAFCYRYPDAAHALLEKITRVTIAYLQHQVKAGVHCVQVFDSWAGLLGPEGFRQFAEPYLQQIARSLSAFCPVILFPKGAWFGLASLCHSGAAAIGIDWQTDEGFARKATNHQLTLQGNLDPVVLLTDPATIRRQTFRMIQAFGKEKYIANLGHGILPQTPVENARAFVQAVQNFSESCID
ncbi:MAG: uroporphyrinogen decarboxylase [Thermoflavifilum aggregans]|nr:uroporphyrinogen decarboxylase [Thermoflavifilum aggregans]